MQGEKEANDQGQQKDTETTESMQRLAAVVHESVVYHPRAAVVCCIIAGEIEEGGLAIRMPVLGLTMGIAFRVRIAAGW